VKMGVGVGVWGGWGGWGGEFACFNSGMKNLNKSQNKDKRTK